MAGGRLRKVVSGGQTGVDRAALDAALDVELATGGWCPRGRRAEDGPIHARYPLRETPSSAYSQRTSWNVRDSDATLVLHRGRKQGGTALTLKLARRLGRPVLLVDVRQGDAPAVRAWLREKGTVTLNVAGPRESEAPGIYEEAVRLLRAVFNSAVVAAPRNARRRASQRSGPVE